MERRGPSGTSESLPSLRLHCPLHHSLFQQLCTVWSESHASAQCWFLCSFEFNAYLFFVVKASTEPNPDGNAEEESSEKEQPTEKQQKNAEPKQVGGSQQHLTDVYQRDTGSAVHPVNTRVVQKNWLYCK